MEPGPQDGTLLVTWQAVTRPPSSGPVTGYAVYADGKKVSIFCTRAHKARYCEIQKYCVQINRSQTLIHRLVIML